MYALLLFALVFQSITSSPSPKKIKEHVPADLKAQQPTQKAKNESFRGKATNSPDAHPDPAAQAEHNKANTNDKIYRVEVSPQPTDPWIKWYVGFTGLMAFVNCGVFVLIWLQHRSIKGQLAEMKKAREQTDALIAQATAQVAEMKNAGTQTDKLIEHAGKQAESLLKAAEISETHVEAASVTASATMEAAKAATKSADTLVQSERAWIYPELAVRDASGLAYNLQVTNFGRTLGHIDTANVGFACIEAHKRPEGPYEYGLRFPDENILILPTQPIVLKNFKINDYFHEQWGDILCGKMQAIVFASIVYRDMVGELHESFCCYGYRLPSSQLEDWKACRKYT